MLGPIQLVVIGFESNEKFKGDIQRELDALRTRGVIRMLDLLFVMKTEDGNVMSIQDTDLSVAEEVEIGAAISRLMGLTDAEADEAPLAPLDEAEDQYGFTEQDILDVAAQIEAGTSAAILLVEHVWAAGFKQAVGEAGGRMLAQGFLTPQALMMVGAELQAIADAEIAIEVAEAVKGAALLDALITVDIAETVKEAAIEDAAETVVAAELVKTAAVADAVRTLIVAGLIEDAAAQEALETLVAAGLIEAEAMSIAEDAVTQAEAVAAAAFAQADDNDDGLAEVGVAA